MLVGVGQSELHHGAYHRRSTAAIVERREMAIRPLIAPFSATGANALDSYRGKRRRYVKPIIEERKVAFMFNESALRRMLPGW
jgi:hypothetical protein